MTTFPKAPALQPIDNDKWLLHEDFFCVFRGKFIRINKGFETDGASIPNTPMIRWIIGHPFSMPLLPCALVHDALYAGELLPRKECDWLFLELMKRAKIGWLKRNTVWSAVRLGGSIVWSRHTVDSVLKARKFCSLQNPRK
jgi:hypothetical protein